MISFYLKDIAKIVSGEFYGCDDIVFDKIITDSRNTGNLKSSLFIAIVGNQHDGHSFIDDLYSNGARAFLISKEVDFNMFREASFIKVNDTIDALHKIAAYKRNLFNIQVIGIAGSNGKTIVKEWISWILNNEFKITKNPNSYNSQVGVPLSLWLIDENSQIGIFEAGISRVGEMQKLEKIIRPSIGILTNIGSAHQANFSSIEQKINEKLKLFENCPVVIYSADSEFIKESLERNKKIKRHITWSENNSGLVNIKKVEYLADKSLVKLEYNSTMVDFSIPYTDKGSVQNAVTCFCVLIALNIELSPYILKRFFYLPSIKMRLEMLNGINNSILINDSYNSDINSLEIAIDYLNQKKAKRNTIVIMSDILQSSESEEYLYGEVSKLIREKNVDKLIGIGEALDRNRLLFPANSLFYKSTGDFIKNMKYSDFHDSAVLLKGARNFRFEKISNKIQAKNHETVIETDLSLVKKNLDFFKSATKPGTKIMAMVKAFSYGSGYIEIASLLEYNRVEYLAVAFIDEGIELREGGIKIPVMVMNSNINSVQSMLEYNLEPEVYSVSMIKELILKLEKKGITGFPIHIKLDTGMHRLGLLEDDIEDFCKLLSLTNAVEVKTVFSHLVGTDEEGLDYYTKLQVELFSRMYDKFCMLTGLKPERHILNSNGIIKFPQYDFEMVRLGIGLYGLIKGYEDKISQVSTFKSVITQIHKVKEGESVGYNRSGKICKDSIIATVPVGYADGLNRKLGNGNWYFYINSKKAFTVGNICMDMCMVDITNVEAEEGDEVIIFGKENSVIDMAGILGTIPYEILTGISQRVKRVYLVES